MDIRYFKINYEFIWHVYEILQN